MTTTDAGGVAQNGQELDEKRRQLKQEYIEAKGFWPEMHNDMLRLDPDFLRAFMEYSNACIGKQALSPQVRELIYVAIDACTTHLYSPGTKNHMRQALSLGVSVDEVMEVLKIVTLVGMHSTTEGVPLLVEVLAENKD